MATTVLSATVWAFACGDGTVEPSPDDPPPPAAVTVVPATATLAARGATLQLTVQMRDRNGKVIEGPAVSWATSDASVATVTRSGLVTAVADDAATVGITATAGDVSATAQLSVADPQYAVLIQFFWATGGGDWTNSEGWGSPDLSTWHGVTVDHQGRITRLDLFNNNLVGPILPDLGDLAHLQSLNLGRNRLSGGIPPELGNLAALANLYLGTNELSGRIPPELGNLGSLQFLNLSGNDLSGGIPPQLGDLGALRELSLAGNDLSGPIPPELGNLESLEHLSFLGIGVTGRIPPELRTIS